MQDEASLFTEQPLQLVLAHVFQVILDTVSYYWWMLKSSFPANQLSPLSCRSVEQQCDKRLPRSCQIQNRKDTDILLLRHILLNCHWNENPKWVLSYLIWPIWWIIQFSSLVISSYLQFVEWKMQTFCFRSFVSKGWWLWYCGKF